MGKQIELQSQYYYETAFALPWQWHRTSVGHRGHRNNPHCMYWNTRWCLDQLRASAGSWWEVPSSWLLWKGEGLVVLSRLGWMGGEGMTEVISGLEGQHSFFSLWKLVSLIPFGCLEKLSLRKCQVGGPLALFPGAQNINSELTLYCFIGLSPYWTVGTVKGN